MTADENHPTDHERLRAQTEEWERQAGDELARGDPAAATVGALLAISGRLELLEHALFEHAQETRA